MNALSRMIEATRPGGHILDLQVVRPDPEVELDGCAVAHIVGAPLFASADAAVAAIDARIAAGDLVEEATDEHDVRKHYTDGAELVDDLAQSKRSLPEQAVPMLRRIRRPLAVRERCRTRCSASAERDPARASLTALVRLALLVLEDPRGGRRPARAHLAGSERA